MFHHFVGTPAEGEGKIFRANSNLGQNQIIAKFALQFLLQEEVGTASGRKEMVEVMT